MGLCAVHDCDNDSQKKLTPDSTFHQFPKDTNLRKKWIKFCKNTIRKTSRICNLHFKKEFIENDFKYQMGFTSLRKLVPGAVPTIRTKDYQVDLKAKQRQLDYWISNKKKSLISQGQQETTTSFDPICNDTHKSIQNNSSLLEIDGKCEIDPTDPLALETYESNKDSLNVIANVDGFLIKQELLEDDSTEYTNTTEAPTSEEPESNICIEEEMKEEIKEEYPVNTNSTDSTCNTPNASDTNSSKNRPEQESTILTSTINRLNEEISRVQKDNLKLKSAVGCLARRNKALNVVLKRRFYEISNLESVLLLSYTKDQVQKIRGTNLNWKKEKVQKLN